MSYASGERVGEYDVGQGQGRPGAALGRTRSSRLPAACDALGGAGRRADLATIHRVACTMGESADSDAMERVGFAEPELSN
jgi:hypothetical protein